MKLLTILATLSLSTVLSLTAYSETAAPTCEEAVPVQCDSQGFFVQIAANPMPAPAPASCINFGEEVQLNSYWNVLEDSDGLDFIQLRAFSIAGGMALYKGSCGALEEVACATVEFDEQCELFFTPEQGETYYIQVFDFAVGTDNMYALEMVCPFFGISCNIAITDYHIPDCRSPDGFVDLIISGTTEHVSFQHEVFLEAGTDAGLNFGNAQIDSLTGTFTGSIRLQGKQLAYIVVSPGLSIYNCGDAMELSLSLPVCPDCSGAPHSITSASNLAPCIGVGLPGSVQATFQGPAYQGRFGIVNEAGDVLSGNKTGIFKMNEFPEGSYRIAHLRAPGNFPYELITNIDELEGCPALSNTIEIQSTELVAGTVSPSGSIALCTAGNFPAFTANGASADGFAWALLNANLTQVVQANNDNPSAWALPEPGNYKLVHLALGAGVDLAALSLHDELGCVARSNVVSISIEPCAPSLELWPNPAQQLVNLQWNDAGVNAHTVEIYNHQGQRLSATRLSGDGTAGITTALHVGNLPRGVYEVVLRYEEGIMRERLLVMP